MPFLALSLALLTLTGPLLGALKPHRWRHSGWLAALPPALVTAWLLTQMPAVSAGHAPFEHYAWVPELGLDISLRLDGLALLFGLIVTGIGAAVALYTGYYFEDDERQGYFYTLLFLFMASMLGLVWSDNLLAVYVFWEGTSITSYLMIAFDTTSRTAREGGRRAFIVTVLGGLAMLAGMVLLGNAAGTYRISEIIAVGVGGALTENAFYVPALLLIALGAFTKSAQFPFHFWLPGAMAAPTPASAYLHSATMVKAGVFLLARLHPALSDTGLWMALLGIVGGITAVLGAVSALRYTDLKAILAYATVSQLGVLVMLLALPGEDAPVAAAVGVLAHALYKGSLFLTAGIVDHATGTRELPRLAGLARPLPWLALTGVVAGLSMAGLPPLLGFLAKETLLASEVGYAAASPVAGTLSLAAVVVMGAFTAAVGYMLIYEPYFRRRGTPQQEPGAAPAETPLPSAPTQAHTGAPADQSAEGHDPDPPSAAEEGFAHVHHKPPFAFVLPALVLALLGVVLSFALVPLERWLIAPAAAAIEGASSEPDLALWHGFNRPFVLSLVALALGLLIFAQRRTLYTLLNRVPLWFSGQAGFRAANGAIYDLARWLTRQVQGGSMASQISVTLLASALIAALALWETDWASTLALDFRALAPLNEVVVAALAVVAAAVTMRTDNRLSAIISLGVVGVAVTLFFIFFSAPDLALTQLLIETLTVVLLVLVFFRVGPDRLPPEKLPVRIFRGFVALAMGLYGFTLVLFNAGVQAGDPIYPYFERFAVPAGQGGNIVNVILVDFRGYDTLGEITVLSIAAIGGFALLRSPGMAALRARLTRRMAQSAAAPRPPAAPSADSAPTAGAPDASVPIVEQSRAQAAQEEAHGPESGTDDGARDDGTDDGTDDGARDDAGDDTVPAPAAGTQEVQGG